MALLQSSADLIEEQVLELSGLAAERVAATRNTLLEVSERARTILLALSALAIAAGALAGWLVASITEMNHGLSEIVREVRGRSHAVHHGAIEIRTRNLELSRRTESQASALEETAAAIASFASAARDSAEKAASADALAHEASEMGRKAGAVTGQLLERFGAIEMRSQKIGEIVALVEGIAFQTNLLALNAAIEAAQAGKAGLGFAVVASEVRRLSQRTAEAAKEISALVRNAGESVAAGGRLAADTGTVIDGVVGRIRLLGLAVTAIASATAEQRATVEQIGEALSQLDRATQDNVDLAEKTSAATAGMEDVAAALGDAVARFRIPEAEAPPAPPIATASSLAPMPCGIVVASIAVARM